MVLLICKPLGRTAAATAFSEQYRPCLEPLFALPQFLGLASGDDSSSAHWFVGTHGDCLIYLDPHTSQPALRSIAEAAERNVELRSGAPLPMKWKHLNASVCMAFLVTSRVDFDTLCDKLRQRPLSDVFEVRDKSLECHDWAECSIDGWVHCDEALEEPQDLLRLEQQNVVVQTPHELEYVAPSDDLVDYPISLSSYIA